MLPINAYFGHVLLLLGLWLLFNYRIIWEVTVQQQPKPKRKGKPNSLPSSDPKPFPGVSKNRSVRLANRHRASQKMCPNRPSILRAGTTGAD
jgi:hypothetical protein